MPWVPPPTGGANEAPLSGRALVLFIELELLSLLVLWQPVAINPTIASKNNIFFIAFFYSNLYSFLRATGTAPATVF
jgi:hypothetical protein